MKLPNLDKAWVPPEKIRDYLLSELNSGGKVEFFTLFGFSVAEWELLAEAIYEHAREYEVVKVEDTRFGTRYVVEGKLSTPDGRTPQVRIVWFISLDEISPRLVTAYPLEERDD